MWALIIFGRCSDNKEQKEQLPQTNFFISYRNQFICFFLLPRAAIHRPRSSEESRGDQRRLWLRNLKELSARKQVCFGSFHFQGQRVGQQYPIPSSDRQHQRAERIEREKSRRVISSLTFQLLDLLSVQPRESAISLKIQLSDYACQSAMPSATVRLPFSYMNQRCGG